MDTGKAWQSLAIYEFRNKVKTFFLDNLNFRKKIFKK